MSDYNSIMIEIDLMEQALSKLKERGRTKAQYERDYRIALATLTLQLKKDGHPATLIRDLVRGDKEVARLKFEMECADTLYKSALEAINVKKIKIRILENQYDKEWGNS